MESRRIILLVDDSSETLMPLSRLLTLCGYDVRPARTAAEALALAAAQQTPDLMISDLRLPDRDGTELMRDVKAQFGLPGIAVTGYTGDETARACRRAGFDRYLSKPIRFEDLRAAVSELLARPPGPVRQPGTAVPSTG